MQNFYLLEKRKEYFGDWLKVLDEGMLTKYGNMLMQVTLNNVSIEPDVEKVFSAFNKCKFNDCCAVILGQDPYPQKGISTGIAFGNNLEKNPRMSPSLEIIFNSVTENSEDMPIFDTTLESWEKQGILMLNSALTVATGNPGSHSQAWKPFISSFMEKMSVEKPNIYWLLLGKQAWDFKDFIKGSSDNVAMEYHPAYFARNNTKMPSKIWDKMISYVEKTFGKTLKLYE